MIRKTRLFTPGPTPLFATAQLDLARDIMHHRTDEFRQLMMSVREGLKSLFQTNSEVLVLASSGTGAMEAAVTNLLSPGDQVIVINGGKFGERWLEIARAFGLEVREIPVTWGCAVDPEKVRAVLNERSDTKAILMQDCESSTAVRHPTREIAELTRGREVCLVVDAITGLGAHDIKTDQWGLDVVIGASQKALGLPPGLALLALNQKAIQWIERGKSPRFYFDLRRELEAQRKGQSGFTPAVSLIVGLKSVLDEIRKISLEGMVKNAAVLAEMTRRAVTALGLELFAKNPANAITAVKSPQGLLSSHIIRQLKEQFGITLANGQGKLKDHIFRITHLGYVDYLDTVGALAALEHVLLDLGIIKELGQGIKAAQQVYRRKAVMK